MMKNLSKLLVILFLTFTSFSCSNDDEPPVITTFKAHLLSEPFATPIAGLTGDAVAILNHTEKTIQFTVTYSSTVPQSPHTVNALASFYGLNLFDLSDKIGATSTSKTFKITDNEIDVFMSNVAYIQVCFGPSLSSTCLNGKLVYLQ